MEDPAMSVKTLSPYITFNGAANDAISLYERVLGAKTVIRTRVGDVPGTDAPPALHDRVLHSALRVGESLLMLSDGGSEESETTAGNVQVSLDFGTVRDMTRAFSGLSDGGAVTLPIQDMFWGAKFGMVTDRFGVRWLLNCDAAAA
jgi:PhnB protein